MKMHLTHRLEVWLSEDQYLRLAAKAQIESRSIGSLIREAVDLVWATPEDEKVRLLDAILAEEPMPVSGPGALAQELDAIRGERFLNH